MLIISFSSFIIDDCKQLHKEMKADDKKKLLWKSQDQKLTSESTKYDKNT